MHFSTYISSSNKKGYLSPLICKYDKTLNTFMFICVTGKEGFSSSCYSKNNWVIGPGGIMAVEYGKHIYCTELTDIFIQYWILISILRIEGLIIGYSFTPWLPFYTCLFCLKLVAWLKQWYCKTDIYDIQPSEQQMHWVSRIFVVHTPHLPTINSSTSRFQFQKCNMKRYMILLKKIASSHTKLQQT